MAFQFLNRQPYKQPYCVWETSVERGESAFKGVAPRKSSSGNAFDDEDGTIHIEHHHHQDHHHVPEVARHPHRARFVGFELPDNRVRRPVAKPKEEEIDDAADGFIAAKHRSFEARAWSTFKK